MNSRDFRSALLCAMLLVAGCAPDLGAPQSLIAQQRILAVKGTPAEAKPGSDVQFQLLMASPGGTVPSPTPNWAFCTTPKPLSENNAVAQKCTADGVAAVTPTSMDACKVDSGCTTATLPDNGCSLFGPDTPPSGPNMQALRPRDPDVTGGFYQPLRVTIVEGAADGGDLVAFALERITCNLAGATLDVRTEFRMRYKPNGNPQVMSVTGAAAGATAQPLVPEGTMAAGGMLASVARKASVTFRVTWSDDSAQTYPVFDAVTRTLIDHRETLSVSWYATGGTFAHDRTGRGEDEKETFTENTWTAPDAGGPVHLWTVLRDSRGGVDSASFLLSITP